MAFRDSDAGAKVSSTSRGGKEIRTEAVKPWGGVEEEIHLTLALPGAVNSLLTKEKTGTASPPRAMVGYQRESGKWASSGRLPR